jgi:hypothetical protein
MGVSTATMPTSASAAGRAKLPVVELKLSPFYAWGVMGFGAIMFMIGLLFLSRMPISVTRTAAGTMKEQPATRSPFQPPLDCPMKIATSVELGPGVRLAAP